MLDGSLIEEIKLKTRKEKLKLRVPAIKRIKSLVTV